ncbi:hypothetical protein GCM10027037_12500 [Mucilaginibacter koreensis]
MVDNPNCYISSEKIARETFERIKNNSSRMTCERNTEAALYHSQLRNLKVTLAPGGLFINGSLAKFYLGDNDKALTRATLKLAVQQLSDELQLDVNTAKVTRLDVGQNIAVNNTPIAYVQLLGECSRYEHLQMKHGKEYRNGERGLVFYDKQAEMKQRKAFMPAALANTNFIRYEARLKNSRSISRNLNVSSLTLRDLYEPEIYRRLYQFWGKEFDSILKITDAVGFSDDAMRTPQQFCNQILFEGIKAMGGYSKLRDMVTVAKHSGVYASPQQYQAVVRKLRLMNAVPDLSVQNELISELEGKVRDIVLLSA